MLKPIITAGLFCAALLVSQNSALAEAARPPSGVTGIVSLAPGCPGPQKKDEECVKPLAGKEVQLLLNGDKVVAKATTGEGGKFTIHAKPGKYSLKVVIDAMYPRCPTVDVKIHKRQLVGGNISCDSGMR